MNMDIRMAALMLTSPLLLASCGGSGGSSAPPPPPPPLADATRAAAATATAANNAKCSEAALGPYYWEVGDATTAKVSDSSSSGAPTGITSMWIFSASKWLYSANVVQKRGVVDSDVPYLNFTSGYTNFGNEPLCLPNAETTVAICMIGRSGGQDPRTIGKFYYDSGHMQQHAFSVMGLGDADNAALAADLNATVGNFGFGYREPQPASGVVGTPQAYAQFLRRLLRGELALAAQLGTHKICTQPKTCPEAYPAPGVDRPETWYYSLGHWVEDDPVVGDHAFSSPGGGGFYPWIDRTKTYYGLIARYRTTEGDAGYHSAECGRLIRQAYVTGVEAIGPTPTPE